MSTQLHKFKKGDITIFWHMAFYDHMLTGIGETSDHQKIYVDCYDDEEYRTYWTNLDEIKMFPTSVQEYVKTNKITQVEDFPEDDVVFEDCIVYSSSPDEFTKEYELIIDPFSKFKVYCLTEAEFAYELAMHRVFQKFFGTHTDYPRGIINPEYLSNYSQYEEDPIVKQYKQNKQSYKKPDRLLGFIYSNNLCYPSERI